MPKIFFLKKKKKKKKRVGGGWRIYLFLFFLLIKFLLAHKELHSTGPQVAQQLYNKEIKLTQTAKD